MDITEGRIGTGAMPSASGSDEVGDQAPVIAETADFRGPAVAEPYESSR